MRVHGIAAGLAITSLCTAAAGQATIFVDAAASGPAHDGVTWCTAFQSLDEALEVAIAGDTILVAEGIYRPMARSEPDLPRTETFRLRSGLTVRGGFAGCGADDPDACDPDLHKTILSGDLAGNDDAVAFPDGPTFADNAYHVVTASEADETALLEGFIIVGGNADGDGEHRSGGGLLNVSGAARFVACTFRRNQGEAAAAVLNHSTAATFADCNFIENGTRGSVISNRNADVTFTDCQFERNGGSTAYTMYNWGGKPTIRQCTFRENIGDGTMYNTSTSPTVDKCLFIRNNGTASSGIELHYGCRAVITDCSFLENEALYAGAVYCAGEDRSRMENCLFEANTSQHAGAAITNFQGTVTLISCTFRRNADEAVRSIGHTLVEGCTFEQNYGTGLRIRNEGSVRGCAFIANEGRGMHCYGNLVIEDCVFARNGLRGSGGGLSIDSGSAVVQDCLFQDNLSFYNGAGVFNSGEPVLIRCVFRRNRVKLSQPGEIDPYLQPGRDGDGNRHTYETGGGGMYSFNGGRAVLVQCGFFGNFAEYGGGLVSDRSDANILIDCVFAGNEAAARGGAIYNINSDATLYNCTVTANYAPEGGAALRSDNSPCHLANTIVWNNPAGQGFAIEHGNTPTTAEHSCIEGGWAGSGNIGELPGHAPQFAYQPHPGPDGLWGTVDDDYGDLRLLPGSACIDAGSTLAVPLDEADIDGDGDTTERVPFDLAGNRRFVNDPNTADTGLSDPPLYPAVVDIGAHEYQACPLDLDGDGTVSAIDREFVMARFGCPVDGGDPACDRADVDGDGYVDAFDSNAVMAGFGACP